MKELRMPTRRWSEKPASGVTPYVFNFLRFQTKMELHNEARRKEKRFAGAKSNVAEYVWFSFMRSDLVPNMDRKESEKWIRKIVVGL